MTSLSIRIITCTTKNLILHNHTHTGSTVGYSICCSGSYRSSPCMSWSQSRTHGCAPECAGDWCHADKTVCMIWIGAPAWATQTHTICTHLHTHKHSKFIHTRAFTQTYTHTLAHLQTHVLLHTHTHIPQISTSKLKKATVVPMSIVPKEKLEANDLASIHACHTVHVWPFLASNWSTVSINQSHCFINIESRASICIVAPRVEIHAHAL